MSKLHLSTVTNKLEPCEASEGRCSYAHYDSPEEYSATLAEEFGGAVSEGLKRAETLPSYVAPEKLPFNPYTVNAEIEEARIKHGVESYDSWQALNEFYKGKYGTSDFEVVAKEYYDNPAQISYAMKVMGQARGNTDETDRVPLARLQDDIEKAETRLAAHNFHDEMGEYERSNMESNIKRSRRVYADRELTDNGYKLSERSTNPNVGDRYALVNEKNEVLGYAEAQWYGKFSHRSYKVYDHSGESLGTKGDIYSANLAIKAVHRRKANPPTPMSNLTLLKDSKAIPQGKQKWDTAFVASIQYNKVEPGTAPTNAQEAGTKTIVVPNTKSLTKGRALKIGEELWRVSGRDMDKWNSVTEEERLRFSKSHIGKWKDVEFSNEHGKVDFTYDRGMGGGHDSSDYSYMEF